MEWLPLTWEAIATMLTGALAVGAAVYVGRKHTEIANRQADILAEQTKISERQTKLTENDLKIQLLERRSNCVQKMREIHNAWFTNACLSTDERRDFNQLITEVELIYPKNITEKLRETHKEIFRSSWKFSTANKFIEIGNKDRGDAMLKEASNHETKTFDLMPSLVDELIEHSRVDFWE